MKKLLHLSIAFLAASNGYTQVYNKEKVCGTDTIHVNYRDLKMGEPVSYKGFECVQAGKLGLRVEFGYNVHSYYGGTKKWLGNHGGPVLGIALVHDKYNIGVRFKSGTINPGLQLVFKGDTLKQTDKLNPNKIDFYAGYSLDLEHNFSFEPWLGMTTNLLYVVNEGGVNKSYDIPTVNGFSTGITLNKYFKLKDFRFLALFLSYGYGFTDFKKVNSSLGSGYSAWGLGLAYKVYTRKQFIDRIN